MDETLFPISFKIDMIIAIGLEIRRERLKLRTKIMLLVASVVAVLLLLNQFPVSMSLQRSVERVSASVLKDFTRQFAESSELIALMSGKDRQEKQAKLQEQARRLENSTYCSGVVITDENRTILYQTSDKGITAEVVETVKHHAPGKDEVLFPKNQDPTAPLYAFHAIRDRDGSLLGQVMAVSAEGKGPQELQESVAKTQRDLNAMTMLVMLIALVVVWNLTDHIKGSMFNLEPEEIAQMLVERNEMIDAVRDGIITVDEDGKVLHCNRTAERLFVQQLGRKAQNFSEVIKDFSLEEIFMREKPLFDYECRMGNDSFFVSFIPIAVENSSRKSLLMTFRPKQEIVRFAEDITGVRSYVEALRAQMHEFNNKLQVIAGLVHERNYDALENYINDLIHLNEREKEMIHGKIRDPILSAFLLSKFARAAEQKVDLVLTGSSHCEALDNSELVQDLVVISGNLLENAFDATQGCAMRMVTLELVQQHREIMISVWNSGKSIPEERLEHIFEYGVTFKPNGSGIGLYLVQKACNRHHGYVSVTSDPQSGTEFVAHVSWKEEV